MSEDDLLVPVPRGRAWPPVQIRRQPGEGDRGPSWVDEERASVPLLGGGHAQIERSQRLATHLLGSAGDEGSLIHPFLSVVGTVFALWEGYEAFHAGAFVGAGGAWAVVGERGAGKSSLLAGLAMAGLPILTDDLVVVVDDHATAGPRCVDLRPPAPAQLRLDGRTRPVRGGERQRLRLAPVAAEVPLSGWISLAWGPELQLHPMTPSERLECLSEQRNLQGAFPTRLLQLVRLPAWKLQRPPSWESFEPAVARLLELAGG